MLEYICRMSCTVNRILHKLSVFCSTAGRVERTRESETIINSKFINLVIGKDIIHTLDLTLEQLYSGHTKKLAINRQVIDKKKGVKRCAECDGKGHVVQVVRMGPMISQMQQPCGSCRGQGTMYSHVQEKEILEVYIERGSIEGSKMTFTCKGDEHPDMEAGDVHFVVAEKEHALFKRNKADLTVDKKISLLEALTGFSFELTHLDGRKLLIKSEPGEVLKPSATKEPEWEIMENTGCDADSVATCQAKDIEKIKEVCVQKGFSGFTYDKSSSTCYFKQADRDEMLEKKKANKTTKGILALQCAVVQHQLC